MNNHLHHALQSTQGAGACILDAEFASSKSFSDSEKLACASIAKRLLMDALERLTSYEHEIRASGTRPTGSKPDEAPPNRVNGSVGRETNGEKE